MAQKSVIPRWREMLTLIYDDDDDDDYTYLKI